MARIKRSVHSKKKRRKVLERASGYKGARGRRYRTANEQVMHAMQDAYRDRRARKGEFRRLWIARINAASREHGMSYSRFIAGLKAAEVDIDRKMLAEMAVSEPEAFGELVKAASAALPVDPVPQPKAEPASKTKKDPAKIETSKPKDASGPVSEKPAKKSASTGVDQETAAEGVRQRFAEGADADPDDLKLIKGVGPVLEGMLNELNIRTFSQIAAFDDDDIAMVTAALTKFKERVTRDNWVDQAKELLAEHHGG